jgi:hypothetical protein
MNPKPNTRALFWEELAQHWLNYSGTARYLSVTMEGISFKDLSEKTGEPVNTLISRKRYAVLHLRERLRGLRDELLNY